MTTANKTVHAARGWLRFVGQLYLHTCPVKPAQDENARERIPAAQASKPLRALPPGNATQSHDLWSQRIMALTGN